MRIVAISFLFALSVAQPASSQTAIGLVDCGKWVQARTQGTAPMLESFLQGYMNGLSRGSRIEFWTAGGQQVSAAQVFLWMDNYCRRSPLSNVYEGASALLNERTNNAWDRLSK